MLLGTVVGEPRRPIHRGRLLRGEEERQRGDDVDAAEHRALQPVGLAVEGDEPGYEDRRGKGAKLQRGKTSLKGVPRRGPRKTRIGVTRRATWIEEPSEIAIEKSMLFL
jgi:hypothetical protein